MTYFDIMSGTFLGNLFFWGFFIATFALITFVGELKGNKSDDEDKNND